MPNVSQDLMEHLNTDWKEIGNDKRKELFAGSRLILRPLRGESGCTGKKTNPHILSVICCRTVRRCVSNPLHHLASGQQKPNDWWRLCSSLADTLTQLVWRAENQERILICLSVPLYIMSCADPGPLNGVCERHLEDGNTPGLSYNPATLPLQTKTKQPLITEQIITQ